MRNRGSARDLPMRDGNSVRICSAKASIAGPRPSYEGWKLRPRTACVGVSIRPRPSYEGWKLFDDPLRVCPRQRPRPSYEGWKLAILAGYKEGLVCPRPSYEGWKLSEDTTLATTVAGPATFL